MFEENTPLSDLADQAFEIASRYKNRLLSPEHVLYAICRDQGGRAAIESIYEGDSSRVLAFLTRSFEQRRSEQASPEVGEEMHRFLALLIEQSTPVGALLSASVPRKMSVEEILDTLVVECLDFPFVAAALSYGGVVSAPGYEGEEDEAFFVPLSDSDVEENFEADLTQARQNSDPNYVAVMESLRNVSDLAQKGELDVVVGRDEEIETLVDILSRRRKRNALLVGDPGVGKSALIEGLAARLVSHPSALAQRPVIEVSLASLMAGSRYRGDFEARIKHLIEFASQSQVILFLDEAHTLMGAGASATGGLDASNMMKPALARGDFSLILATTVSESRSIVKDKAFSRRFEPLLVKEPNEKDMISILMLSKEAYERHHNVSLSQEMAALMISRAAQFLPQRRFPDKAFDVLDLSAQQAVKANLSVIDASSIDGAIEKMSGRVPGRPSQKTLDLAETFESQLNDRVIGQEKALKVICGNVRQAIYGFSSLGCASAHLLNGPSGVGKTETAKAVADILGLPFNRIDMSEFMEKHSVSGLIGAAPGYVGYENSGRLIECIERAPNQVLLLDEVDKAHPEVFDLLLQVLDAGCLTSADGRMVFFQGVHVFMTSNLGAQAAQKSSMGFGRETDQDEQYSSAVASHFRKEFLERLSGVVCYENLDASAAAMMIEKEMSLLWKRFFDKGYTISHTRDVVEHLCAKMGAASGRRARFLVSKECVGLVSSFAFKHPVSSSIRLSVENGSLKVGVESV